MRGVCGKGPMLGHFSGLLAIRFLRYVPCAQVRVPTGADSMQVRQGLCSQIQVKDGRLPNSWNCCIGGNTHQELPDTYLVQQTW